MNQGINGQELMLQPHLYHLNEGKGAPLDYVDPTAMGANLQNVNEELGDNTGEEQRDCSDPVMTVKLQNICDGIDEVIANERIEVVAFVSPINKLGGLQLNFQIFDQITDKALESQENDAEPTVAATNLQKFEMNSILTMVLIIDAPSYSIFIVELFLSKDSSDKDSSYTRTVLWSL
ncbi:hypothetical protein CEXT_571401 [Caerostris extrusa]|uniref:Uncharacterized protein n=1 Tax=Caerostris extrusa TaxID=172846 RepID=A0AAV4V0K3_CAEEX|nr:hypothetical protein CEXT_571401 [Caerostris extrusa]